MKRQCVTVDQAELAEKQHARACSDCPFARTALNGWLGGLPPEAWIALASAGDNEPCHVHDGAHCAGMAIFRANNATLPRDPRAFRLPADHQRVFSTATEFIEHHRKPPERFK